MKARLIYKTEDDKRVLEKMELRQLDQFIYTNFNSYEDVIRSKKYNIDSSDITALGEIYIGYYPADLPFTELYHYTVDGVDFTEEQKLEPIYRAQHRKPDQMSFTQDIQILLRERENIKKVFNVFIDAFTECEKLYYYQGMATGNLNNCMKGIERYLSDVACGEEGYFFTRLVRNSIFNNDYSKGENFSIYQYCNKA